MSFLHYNRSQYSDTSNFIVRFQSQNNITLAVLQHHMDRKYGYV